MKSASNDYLRRLSIRLRSWEYWPMWIVYASVTFYFIYLSIKARSLLFFSASNPGIEYGGMCFERKSKIYEILPKEYCPATLLIHPEDNEFEVEKKLSIHNVNFPLIAKPDIGGKGWGVKKIKNKEELFVYQSQCKVEFLVQAWVSFPMEFSIFYALNPASEKGMVTSLTYKSLLTVTGDGVSSIEELIRKDDRAFLQMQQLLKDKSISFGQILSSGEKLTLVPYGNHARGALFRDYHHLIDQELINTFDVLSRKIKGFYFGRYDVLTTSIEDLKAGKNISIVELNGCGAEPIHIYEPGYSFWEGQKVIWSHFRMMYEISMQNHKKGVPFLKPAAYITGWYLQKLYKKNAPAEKLI